MSTLNDARRSLGSIDAPLPMLFADQSPAIRAEGRHNRARVDAVAAGRPDPGRLTPTPVVPTRTVSTPDPSPGPTSRPNSAQGHEDRVREILASGEWISHNAIGRSASERRTLAPALYALLDSGAVVRRASVAADGSRSEYRLRIYADAER